MTPVGWAAWAVVGIAFLLVLWGVHADRRDYTEIRADLDDLRGEHHSPADRVNALEEYAVALEEIVTALEAERLTTGRHAHTGEHPTAPIGGPR